LVELYQFCQGRANLNPEAGEVKINGELASYFFYVQ
jgi:hypothetical protein